MRECAIRNTVEGPGAMVIHLWDTPLRRIRSGNSLKDVCMLPFAGLAVVSSRRLELIALFAPSLTLLYR